MSKYPIEGHAPDNTLKQYSAIIKITLSLLFLCNIVLHAADDNSQYSVGYIVSSETATTDLQQSTQQPNRIPVTGKVTDAYNDEPIPGVNVVISGTTLGQATRSGISLSVPIYPITLPTRIFRTSSLSSGSRVVMIPAISPSYIAVTRDSIRRISKMWRVMSTWLCSGGEHQEKTTSWAVVKVRYCRTTRYYHI